MRNFSDWCEQCQSGLYSFFAARAECVRGDLGVLLERQRIPRVKAVASPMMVIVSKTSTVLVSKTTKQLDIRGVEIGRYMIIYTNIFHPLSFLSLHHHTIGGHAFLLQPSTTWQGTGSSCDWCGAETLHSANDGRVEGTIPFVCSIICILYVLSLREVFWEPLEFDEKVLEAWEEWTWTF